jgi:hypothetical protein
MVDIEATRAHYDKRETRRRTQREHVGQQWLQCTNETIPYLVLSSIVRQEMDMIAAIYEGLERHPLEAYSESDTLIVIGYQLHNLYNAFENIFRDIAAVFENSVDDVGQWHTRLLERMRLDVMPLRPAVIDDEAYDALDELRRFRHLFRHAYSVKLDSERLQLVVDKAFDLKSIYAQQLDRFLDFLQSLMQEE